MTTAIQIENVSKLYRLGTVGTGTLAYDLNRWWHAIRGKEESCVQVSQVSDTMKVWQGVWNREGHIGHVLRGWVLCFELYEAQGSGIDRFRKSAL